MFLKSGSFALIFFTFQPKQAQEADQEISRVMGQERQGGHGLGNLVPLLSSFEILILYYIRQRVTNLMIL
jgi:hypothetical protein